jgi:hypothetical protein
MDCLFLVSTYEMFSFVCHRIHTFTLVQRYHSTKKLFKTYVDAGNELRIR